MLKHFFLIFSLFSFTACSAAMMNSQINSDAKRGMDAWNKVDEQAYKKCSPKQPDQISRSEAPHAVECTNSLITKIVLPISPNPDLVTNFQTEKLNNARLYAKGKITKIQWLERSQAAWQAYGEAWNGRA